MILIAGFLVSLVAAVWFWSEAENLDRGRFLATVTNLMEQLDARTERYAEQLERLADLVENKQEVSVAEWNELVKKLEPRSNLPAFIELAFATNRSMPSRAEVERMQRTEPLLDFIKNPPLKVTRSWLNETSFPTNDTEPWLHLSQVTACWWATASGRLSSSPRRLLPASDGEPRAAVSLFVPVFASDFLELNEFNPKNSRQLRHHRFKGIVIGTIGWRDFLETALPATTGEVGFEAFADAASPAQISRDNWMGRGGVCQPLAPDFRPRFESARKWPFFRNPWQLVFYTTHEFDRHSTRYRSWVALAGGFFLSSMMAFAMAVQLRARRRQEAVTHQLKLTLEQLETARRERERLSHDLHDGTIQSLYALQLGLSRAAEQAMETLPPLGALLANYRRNLTTVIVQLRGYILRHELDEGPQGDLPGLLTSLVERMRSTSDAEIVAEVSHEAAHHLSGEQSVHLANLAHEALSNAMRHSRARRITVALRYTAERVTLEIRDNGEGFDPKTMTRKGVGLQSMKKRAATMGGIFKLESSAGVGTEISVSVPVTRDSQSNTDP